jgi:hypothetical protein
MRLPIFYHVPKNAGTYTYNFFYTLLHANSREELTRIDVRRGNDIVLRFIIYDKSSILANYSGITYIDGYGYECTYDLWCELAAQVNILFAIVVGDFSINLCDCIPHEIVDNAYKFMHVRETYNRQLSLYSYWKSGGSQSEDVSVTMPVNMKEYINSDLLEDSWVIRSFLNLWAPGTNISIDNYNEVCEIIDDNIDVHDLGDVHNNLLNISKACYGAQISTDLSKLEISGNINRMKKNDEFMSLDTITRRTFLERTMWDKRLYDKYTRC